MTCLIHIRNVHTDTRDFTRNVPILLITIGCMRITAGYDRRKPDSNRVTGSQSM